MEKKDIEDQSKDLTSRISGKREQKIERRKILKSIRRKLPGAEEKSCLHSERVDPLLDLSLL